MKPVHRTVAVVLLALAISSLLGSFPHDHSRSEDSLSGKEPPAHGPHEDARLETDGFQAPETSCAICFFQRILSKAPVSGSQVGAPGLSHAPLSVSSDSTVLVDVAFVAEPRGPPVS
jgi:hypothetical protein